MIDPRVSFLVIGLLCGALAFAAPLLMLDWNVVRRKPPAGRTPPGKRQSGSSSGSGGDTRNPPPAVGAEHLGALMNMPSSLVSRLQDPVIAALLPGSGKEALRRLVVHVFRGLARKIKTAGCAEALADTDLRWLEQFAKKHGFELLMPQPGSDFHQAYHSAWEGDSGLARNGPIAKVLMPGLRSPTAANPVVVPAVVVLK